ncbi:MAG TPA: PQQ-binding-like beta-propeller repeat protein [Vicinamibacteria bacterium]|nr:PQQ-binding-like beta-propeller repeat protein [Vicinamibacteria bacterium]
MVRPRRWRRALGLSLAVLTPASAARSAPPAPPAGREWRSHGGDPGHTQYSPLTQIDTANVKRLRQAWVHRTGDKREDDRSQIQCQPIVVDGVLYATSPAIKLFALDAGSGRPLWTFDPFAAGATEHSLGVSRGVTYWSEGEDRRIFFAAGQKLYAVDARTGRPAEGFGRGGSVDLAEGLGRDARGIYVLSNTPGAVYRDLLIVGSRVSEGPGPAAPGHIRAYDVRTGRIRWTFHTIPHPGELGYDTWPPDAWRRAGGANAWSGITVDHERGLVFLPTGSAAFDFWGGNRHGANLFANCLLVLNAATGERVWHYQFVHHDLWDRDLPAAPVLVTVRHEGRRIDAVAQATKSGHVFLFERETGRALFPIEERPVPPSDLKGEEAWPTQPLPLKPPPFARQVFTEDEATSLSETSRAAVLERLRRTRTGRPFIPPSEQGTVIFPGFDGGAEWGGQAFDPATGLFYVNSNEMPWILTMVELEVGKKGQTRSLGERVYNRHCGSCHGVDLKGVSQMASPSLLDLGQRRQRTDIARLLKEGKGVMPAYGWMNTAERDAVLAFILRETDPFADAGPRPDLEDESPYTITGYNRFFDPEGYPAVKPPWGTLNAIDLDKGEIAWTVPLGELPELTARGIPPTGTENYGGPVVTAGGLVFIGGTKDEKFRAFDKRTGQVLWETSLPAGGYASPATYEVGGRQYVVIAAGGGKMGTKSGDAYVAFALPD